VLSLALAAALAATPASHAQAPKEIVIGVIYPMTGQLAQLGIDSVTAMKMATELYNGKSDLNLPSMKTTEGLPGLGGARIRLVIVDHQGKPDVGQSEAERLITQEKVHAIIGAVHSSVTATASQVAERYGVPYMNGESSSPTLTERGFKWFFRTSPHDGHFSLAMFEFMKEFEKKKGIKFRSVGIMHEDTLFGADSAKVQEEPKKYGTGRREHGLPQQDHEPRRRSASSRPPTPTSSCRPPTPRMPSSTSRRRRPSTTFPGC
jgi:branched-chain amino acid transport system substrate-binding protein